MTWINVVTSQRKIIKHLLKNGSVKCFVSDCSEEYAISRKVIREVVDIGEQLGFVYFKTNDNKYYSYAVAVDENSQPITAIEVKTEKYQEF